MANIGYDLVGIRTDDLTGKTMKFPYQTGGNLATVTGEALLINGSNYQVTTGKTFYITGLLFFSGSNPNNNIQLTYADDAAQTTNKVVIFQVPPTVANTAYPVIIPVPASITVPAQKYPGLYNSSGGTLNPGIIVIGYEA